MKDLKNDLSISQLDHSYNVKNVDVSYFEKDSAILEVYNNDYKDSIVDQTMDSELDQTEVNIEDVSVNLKMDQSQSQLKTSFDTQSVKEFDALDSFKEVEQVNLGQGSDRFKELRQFHEIAVRQFPKGILRMGKMTEQSI